MVDEPDNVVLRLLREIREKQDEHDRRFDRLERRFEDMRGYLNHALGMGVTGHLKNEEQDVRLDQNEARHKRMDELFRQIEQRLVKVESDS